MISTCSAVSRKTPLALRLGLIVFLGASLLVSSAAWAQTKIGFVRTDRILKESSLAQAANKRLESEFLKREKEIQDLASRVRSLSEKLERDGPVLAEKDRMAQQREISDTERDFQRKQRELREDVNQRKNEELAAIVQAARRAISEIGKEEKFDLILEEQGVIYGSPRVDITDKVLRALGTKASGK